MDFGSKVWSNRKTAEMLIATARRKLAWPRKTELEAGQYHGE